MTIGIVIPVHARTQSLIDLAFATLKSLQSSHDLDVHVIVNRVDPVTTLAAFAEAAHGHQWEQEVVRMRLLGNLRFHDGEDRCVAASWNLGVRNLRAWPIAPPLEFILILNADAPLNPDTIDILVQYGRDHPELAMWSAINQNEDKPEYRMYPSSEGIDFSCFMIRPDFVDQYGTFDENFQPMYYEDNDVYARVILGGGRARKCHAAKFNHYGSATIRLDPAAQQTNNRTFNLNREYFARKWGVRSPGSSDAEILATYHRHPYGQAGYSLKDWDTPMEKRVL